MIEISYKPEFFVRNKYLVWYDALMRKRFNNPVLEGYSESHHIIPNCFEKNSDTVDLTAREHFIAHVLLTKCTIGRFRSKMVWALKGFRFGHKEQATEYQKLKNSKTYEIAKKLISEEAKIWAKKYNDTRKGRKLTEEECLKFRKPKSTTDKMKWTRSEAYRELLALRLLKGKEGRGNAMENEGSRNKVRESKIGRRGYISPDGTRRICVHPGKEPHGFQPIKKLGGML